MANTISPNMNLVIPGVATEPGPTWASDLNASLSIIDGHNHTTGSGVPIPPDGLNINSDLTFGGNNATNLRSTRYSPQGSPITAISPDLGCLYVSGVDLYYNDVNGNQVRITQSGSVTGSAGTITGLPSGTASASFTAGTGTFKFEQSTGNGANMDTGTLVVRYPGSYPTPSGANYISLQVPSTISAGYAITLPPSAPATKSYLAMDSAGVITSANKVNNIVQSSSSGTILYTNPTSSPQSVTNLTVSITTTGGPVMVCIQPDGGGSTSGVQINQGGALRFELLRGSSVVSSQFFRLQPNTSDVLTIPASMVFLDTPGAGTYTYSVQANNILFQTGSSTITLFNLVLVAYEL